MPSLTPYPTGKTQTKSRNLKIEKGNGYSAMLHEGEIEVDQSAVRQLIADQFPQWNAFPLEQVESEGTSNVLFRIGDEWIARFPRTRGAAEQIEKEWAWLPYLAKQLPLRIPTPVAQGAPQDRFPQIWSIYQWLEGNAFPESGDIVQPEFAKDLARFIRCLQSIDTKGGPAPGSHNFYRGTPLRSRDRPTREAIRTLSGKIDEKAVTAAWETALLAPEDNNPTWIHGDLLPGNLLFDHGRLTGVIDFGGLGVGDPACDLMPAWNFFAPETRQIFRKSLEVNETAWVRGRGWALSQALIYIPYYLGKRPQGVSHAFRVIDEIVAEQQSEV